MYYRSEWAKYTSHLSTMNEGVDSDGVEMKLSRYARFLELYVQLDQAERVQRKSDQELKVKCGSYAYEYYI